MNRSEITLGVIPVQSSTTTRTDAKTGSVKTSTAYTKWALMAYYVKDGKQGKVPFAQIQKHVGMGNENIVTVGSRDKLLAVAYVLGAAGFLVKPYVKGGAESAVQRLKKRAEKGVERAEKVMAGGKEAYLETVKANGEKAWENMPSRLEETRKGAAMLDGILALIRNNK